MRTVTVLPGEDLYGFGTITFESLVSDEIAMKKFTTWLGRALSEAPASGTCAHFLASAGRGHPCRIFFVVVSGDETQLLRRINDWKTQEAEASLYFYPESFVEQVFKTTGACNVLEACKWGTTVGHA